MRCASSMSALTTAGQDSVVEIVATLCGADFQTLVDEAPDRMGQDARYYLSVEKAKSLGWSMTVPLNAGVASMVDWVRKYPELLSMDTSYRHRL